MKTKTLDTINLLRPWTAAIFSLLLPGLGHLQASRYRRGLVAFLVMIGFDALGSFYAFRTFGGMVLTVAVACLWTVLVAVDAFYCARREQGQPGEWFTRWTALLPVALLAAYFGVAVPGARYQFFSQTSVSMAPTLHPGDHCVVDMGSYRAEPPMRQDLVVFEAPEDALVRWVMRCVAVAGDLVEVRDGVFYLNGVAQDAETGPVKATAETLASGPPPSCGPLRVPEGTVFCLGDNRGNSFDSRFWGPLRIEAVRGKALYSYRIEAGWTLAKVTSKRLG